MFSELNVGKRSFVLGVILVAVLTVLTGSLFIYNKVDSLNRDLAALEQDFIEQQKSELKSDVTGLIERIAAQRTAMQDMFEQQQRRRVEEARLMAEHIYQSMHGRMADNEIGRIIREALRPIRLTDKDGHLFILNTDGDVILYAADSHLEGTSFLSGAKGDMHADVVRNLIGIARDQGGGFFRYERKEPGDRDDRLSKKISYVTLFKPFNWVIGTGESLDDLDLQTRAAIIRELRESLPSATTASFVVYELKDVNGGKNFANILIDVNRPGLVGHAISDDELDALGTPFRKGVLADLRSSSEAFAVYRYKKPDGPDNGRKLSYFKLYPDWNWIVARTVDFEGLDRGIFKRKAELREKVRDDIILLSFIFLVGVAIVLLIAFLLSRGMQKISDTHRQAWQEQLDKVEAINKALEQQSRTDTLTQVYNRRFFNKQMSIEIARSRRYSTPLALILFDIDNFKQVNDGLGHLTGDAVLQEIARLVEDNIRQTDILARWGGEEFVILAPGVDLAECGRFAEKLRALIERHHFSSVSSITCSFGLSLYANGEQAETFLQRADECLYQAKQEGKNRCVAVAALC